MSLRDQVNLRVGGVAPLVAESEKICGFGARSRERLRQLCHTTANFPNWVLTTDAEVCLRVSKENSLLRSAARYDDGAVPSPTTIRQARGEDNDSCVRLVRSAFFDVYRPGCHEHLLWQRATEPHPDLVAELTLVAESSARIVGCILTTVAHVIDDRGSSEPVLALGPLGVLPSHQGGGVGSDLVRRVLALAEFTPYAAAFLYGRPSFYRRFGFRDAELWSVTTAEGDNFPDFMAKELRDGALSGVRGRLVESSLFTVDDADVHAFDAELFSATPNEAPL